MKNADGQSAKDVDQGDDDTGDGIPAHEFVGAVHGTVVFGFARDQLPSGLGLLFVDDAGIQIGIDAHLFTRHRIQGEAGGDLGDAAGTFGDHHEVDENEDQKDDDADHVVAADHKPAEGLDDLAGRQDSLVAVEQDDAGGRNVKRQPE